MNEKALVITGTSGAGKTSLGLLLASSSSYKLVRALTTRSPRLGEGDEQYVFTSEAEFTRHTDDQFLTQVEYREHNYGILVAEFEATLKSGSIPVAIVAPESLEEVLNQIRRRFPDTVCVSLYLDEPDQILNERQKLRGEAADKAVKQREIDRLYSSLSDYRLWRPDHNHLQTSVNRILDLQARTGLLPRDYIVDLCRAGILLQGFDETNVEGASYDLQLGDEYYYAGRVRTLSPRSPFLMIEPYDYAIVSAAENARLPADIAARFGLSISLFCQGIIASRGPQVDPGFRGSLFCLLFNTSSKPVVLKRGQHFATMEFERLMQRTTPYAGSKQDRTSIIDYLPANTAVGAINELKKEVESLKAANSSLQTFMITTLSLTLALIAVLVAFK
jgi:guanylate kinase/deoxycytidine triphosphate deaminase